MMMDECEHFIIERPIDSERVNVRCMYLLVRMSPTTRMK